MDKPLIKSTRVKNRLAYAGIILMLTISAVITFGVNRKPNQPQTNQVLNKTRALEVTSVTAGQNNSLNVTVKNILPNKSITGIVFKNGNVQIETDFISGLGDNTIAPGKTSTRVFFSSENNVVLASDISILAVVVDDLSIDGEMRMGQRILDRRQGKKEQLQLILPILKEAMDSKIDNKGALAIANTNKIPHPHDLETHPLRKEGAHAVRELILSKIQDSASSSMTRSNQALSEVYEEYSRLLAKL